jgi:hypothetical protein
MQQITNIFMTIRTLDLENEEWVDPSTASTSLQTTIEKTKGIDTRNPEFAKKYQATRIGKFMLFEINNVPETMNIKFPLP